MTETELETAATDGFHAVCLLSDLEDDTALHVEVDGTPVAVARCDGAVYALRDVCSHADVPLSEGDVEDCQVECWLHGSSFDLRTGEPSGLPATVAVPVYATRVDGDQVLVALRPPSGVTAADGTTTGGS